MLKERKEKTFHILNKLLINWKDRKRNCGRKIPFCRKEKKIAISESLL